MANPNLATAATVRGNNTSVTPATAVETLLVSNAANSNTLIVIDSITVANISAAVANFTLTFYTASASNTGAFGRIAFQVDVQTKQTLVPVNRSQAISLREAQSLYITPSVGNALSVTVAWKEFVI